MRSLQSLIAVLVLSASLIGCRHSPPAEEQAHHAGEELGHGARKAGEAIRDGARAVGHTFRSAAQGVRDGIKGSDGTTAKSE